MTLTITCDCTIETLANTGHVGGRRTSKGMFFRVWVVEELDEFYYAFSFPTFRDVKVHVTIAEGGSRPYGPLILDPSQYHTYIQYICYVYIYIPPLRCRSTSSLLSSTRKLQAVQDYFFLASYIHTTDIYNKYIYIHTPHAHTPANSLGLPVTITKREDNGEVTLYIALKDKELVLTMAGAVAVHKRYLTQGKATISMPKERKQVGIGTIYLTDPLPKQNIYMDVKPTHPPIHMIYLCLCMCSLGAYSGGCA